MSLRVESVTCGNCGASIDLKAGARAKTFVCGQCGAVCDQEGVKQLQRFFEQRARYRPWSDLRLGMKGMFQGHTYEIVGRIRYEEEDEEEGESWFWDEWFLITSNGMPLWLTEAEGRFSYFKKFTPTNPVDPRSGTFHTIDLDGGGTAEVVERGSGKIVFLEGEFTWQAEVGEVTSYLNARRGERLYTIEYTDEEIEFQKGRELEPAFVYRIFKIDAPVPPRDAFDEETVEEEEAPSWGPVLRILEVTTLLFLLLALHGMTKGVTVAERRFAVPAITQEPGILRVQISNARNATAIELKTDLSNLTFGLALEIYAEEGDRPLFTYETEFWDERGTDLEGSWHESDEKEKIFVRFLRPGVYRLQFQASRPAAATLSVRVKEGVWLVRWFLIAAGLTGFLPLLALISRLEFSNLVDDRFGSD